MFSDTSAIRSHELHKYCNDSQHPTRSPFDVCLPDSSTLRGALTIFADALLARFGACGAFVILSDGKAQYILAESLAEQEHGDTNIHPLGRTNSDVDALLWLGRQALDLDIGAQSSRDRQLVVLDASRHDRLRALSSVSGPPSIRFCVAVPITTSTQVSIGYILVLGTNTRSYPSDHETNILSSVATQCIGQLELYWELEVRRREAKMTEGLSNFLQRPPEADHPGRRPSHLQSSPTSSPARQSSPKGKRQRTQSSSDTDPLNGGNDVSGVGQGLSGSSEEISQSQSADSTNSDRAMRPMARTRDSVPSRKRTAVSDNTGYVNNETPYRRIFRRAAEFLRKALDVDGVLFADGLIGFHGTIQSAAEPEQELEHEMGQDQTEDCLQEDSGPKADSNESTRRPAAKSRASHKTMTPASRTFISADYRKDVFTKNPSEILGLSMCPDSTSPSFRNLSKTTLGLGFIDEGFLQYMMECHTRGKAWYFDNDAVPYHYHEKVLKLDQDPTHETKTILQAFGGIRQLVFVPLTDSLDLKALAGCFIWTTGVRPVLSDADLPSLKTFLHIVEAEISRIDNLAALKQKESFMSSVSHELRSPLHGILGAVEFLVETGLDSFQQSLTDTINACGTTLHETLSSVLSYAKINEFERRRDNPRQDLPRLSPWSLENKDADAVRHGGNSDGMFICTNLAELCEEILEVVHGGHQRSMLSLEERVTVTLDIAFRESWNFMTEPGALRRIMMNIIGNALKYTSEGTVAIYLHVDHNAGPDADKEGGNAPIDLVVFSVTDSGKGMSNAFLENHLFVPFSQEDPLGSDGVGLGMSIVKSLVALLGGQMKVDSQVGQGTTMTVSMPMHAHETLHPDRSATRLLLEHNVLALRKKSLNVATYGIAPPIEETLRPYLSDWFRCTISTWEERRVSYDVVFVGGTDESCPSEISKWVRSNNQERRPAVIYIGHWNLSKSKSLGDNDINESCFEPLGPGKLAKALARCLGIERPPTRSKRESQTIASKVAPPAVVPPYGQTQHPDIMNAEARPMPGTQTTFDSVLTPSQLPTSQGETNSAAPSQQTPREGNHNPHVLIVEDNPINLNLLRTYLKKRGYTNIESAENGLLAVQAVERRTEGFGIIFMDISMPEMDGFEATRLIRELESERRTNDSEHQGAPAMILALTGLASAQDRAKAYESGVDMFMAKPLKFKQLGALLTRLEKGEKPG